MSKTLVAPCLADEGVFFMVNTGFTERKCLVSRNALAYLGRLQTNPGDFMSTYLAFEDEIHSAARRLVTAGESGSPLILGAAYFVGVAMPSVQ